jgi:transcriptional regulator with XRE-family HTH domain
MPNIDQAAKAWELDLADRVGGAVQVRRKALKLTAQQLAQRTAELGYPITRVAVSKIESNNRAGKLDVAELFVLAVALEIPPALLLFPNFPDGTAELVPGRVAHARGSVEWLSGNGLLPGKVIAGELTEVEYGPANEGTDLVGAVNKRVELEMRQFWLMSMERAENAPADAVETTRRMIANTRSELAATNEKINKAMSGLWASREDDSNE